MSDLTDFLDYHFSVVCLCCKAKVLDPDKRKGQIHLKGKCPSCGKDSKEEKKSKRQRKLEKQLAKQEEKKCKAKYHDS